MLEQLSQRLQKVVNKFSSGKKLTEANIQEGLREVRLALLEADVNYQVVKDFIARVKKEAMGEESFQSVAPSQQFIKIVYDALVDFMGGEGSNLKLKKSKASILLCGLQGSGKTTTAAKLAARYKDQYRFLLVSTDVHRPAAMEQLQILAKDAGVAFFDQGMKLKKAADIVKKAKKFALSNGYNGLIVDTAGRLEADEEMMAELSAVNKQLKADEIFFVADATAGQAIADTVDLFQKTVPLTGLILSKFDSDTRGGAALSVRYVTGKPVVLTGTGEKILDLDVFYPDRIASRILGRGDILSLVEESQKVTEEDEARKLEEKFKKNQFDLEDFRDQIQKIKKMGSLSKLMEMMPGAANMQQTNMDDKELVRVEAIISSMTPFERKNTKILGANRRRRIAKGSGTTIRDVNNMLKKYQDMKKMMKKMSKNPQIFDKFTDNSLQEMGDNFPGMPGL